MGLLLGDGNLRPRFLDELGNWLRTSPEHVRPFQWAMASDALSSRLGTITGECRWGFGLTRRSDYSRTRQHAKTPISQHIWRPNAQRAPESAQSHKAAQVALLFRTMEAIGTQFSVEV